MSQFPPRADIAQDQEIIRAAPKPSAEQQAQEIERRSPEGRPADPTVRGPSMLAWLLIAVVGVIAAAAIMVAFQGLAAGIAVLVMGLALAVFVNTEVWASIFRARERAKMDHETTPSRPAPSHR